uniref:Major facilitator superfamily (MFS) profile domain-containing protein n=3 Tax=Meloidogyne incognita group TaxID=654580 RepID=A0A914LM58_MELIC
MIYVRKDHLIVFVLTFSSYALYHSSRKALSGVKASISEDWIANSTITHHQPLFNDLSSAQNFLGSLDALFMFFYAISLVFWGWLGDRMNPLCVVVFGMVGSAIALTAFGSLPYWLAWYSLPWYLFTWSLFGIVQACGWPNEVTIMANWFPQSNRGAVMGLWSACQPVGNIVGAIIASFTLPMGYQSTFVFNSLIILIGAIVMLLFVKPKPQLVQNPLTFEIPTERRTVISNGIHSVESDEETVEIMSPRTSTPRPIRMCEAIFLPSVLPYCLCNACLKFVNYAFFFWLPFYLTFKYRWNEAEANQLSIWYDIGGIFGSILGGMASDRLKHRSPVLVSMLICSVPLLFLYASLGPNRFFHIIGMSLLGFTISGPYNLIVSTISVDLGSQSSLAGNAEAMSTVTGLIDGTGSAGSAFGQLFIPLIQNNFGWNWVFYLFVLMNILSVLCLMRRFLHDLKLIWLSKESAREHRRENEPLLGTN